MRKLIVISILLALIFATALAYAGWVNGYYRSDANSTRSDNFGRPSAYDSQWGVPASQRDYDGDGIPNRLDSDDDNDGTSDDNE